MSSPENLKIVRDRVYTNGFNNAVEPKKAEAAQGFDRQKVGQGWGGTLVAIGIIAALGGGALITFGVLKIKAVPFLSDAANIGIGVGLVVVGAVSFTGGIVLIKKTYWKDPAYHQKIWEEIRNSNHSFSYIMDHYPIDLISKHRIISEKQLANRFLDEMEGKINSGSKSYRDVIYEYSDVRHNKWGVKLGANGFLSYLALEPLFKADADKVGHGRNSITKKLDPALFIQNYNNNVVHDGSFLNLNPFDPNQPILRKEDPWFLNDFLEKATQMNYLQMKSELKVQIENGAITTNQIQQILISQWKGCQEKFGFFWKQHKQGVWEMIKDGLLTANNFRHSVETLAQGKTILELVNEYGVELFYLEKSAENKNPSVTNADLRILQGNTWINQMNREINDCKRFSTLVQAFGGNVESRNWGHLETLFLKAGLGTIDQYRTVLHKDIKDMNFQGIDQQFGEKVFLNHILEYTDPVVNGKFKKLVGDYGIKKALSTYPNYFYKVLSKEDIKGLILAEIELKGVAFEAYALHFGLDVFQYVERKNIQIQQGFEQMIRVQGFCDAWSSKREDGKRTLAQSLLNKITEKGGFEERLDTATVNYNTTRNNATLRFNNIESDARFIRDGIINPLKNRVEELKYQINNEIESFNKALKNYSEKCASLNESLNSHLKRAENARETTINHAALSISTFNNQIIANERGLQQLRAEQAKLSHSIANFGNRERAELQNEARLKNPQRFSQIPGSRQAVPTLDGLQILAGHATARIRSNEEDSRRLNNQLLTSQTQLLIVTAQAEGTYKLACKAANHEYTRLQQELDTTHNHRKSNNESSLKQLRLQLSEADKELSNQSFLATGAYNNTKTTAEIHKDSEFERADRELKSAKEVIDKSFKDWKSLDEGIPAPSLSQMSPSFLGGSRQPNPYTPYPPQVNPFSPQYPLYSNPYMPQKHIPL